MAEGALNEKDTVLELKKEITCGICQDYYTEPKILPCLHYYCKQCVLKLALRTSTGHPFSCPECRNEATLPEGGVDKLQTAFFINRFKTTVLKMDQACGKTSMKCELCSDSEDKAEAFCRQCAMFICKDCIRQHKRLKTYLNHVVASLEDTKQGYAKPVDGNVDSTTLICKDHGESLVIYCFSCGISICRDCTLKDHKDHEFEFCRKVSSTTKSNLTEMLRPLKSYISTLSKSVKETTSTRKDLEAQLVSVTEFIKSSFSELHSILEKREKELLVEAETITNRKVASLQFQENEFSKACTKVKSIIHYTELCISHCTDNEIVSMQDELKRQITQAVEERTEHCRLEPVEEADVSVQVKCAEALRQLCHTQANIVKQSIDLAESSVSFENTVKPEVGKPSQATLVTRLSNRRVTKRSCQVSGTLTSLYTGDCIQCEVDRDPSKPGKYSILYTPAVRGHHQLEITVDGQQVAHSPFSLFVSIYPTLLVKPVKIYKDIPRAAGITVNSLGEILVSSYCGKIVKFSKSGRQKIEILNHDQIKDLRKIEVDEDDNIYCICESQNKILKCDKNGENVQILDITYINRGQRGLAVCGKEIKICEYSSNGTVQIYDHELKYVRKIQLPVSGDFLAVSSDNHGNVYCADRTNSCIQVISNDGTFLHSFSCDRNGAKRVNNSWGLCVFGHYVYVANAGSASVSVFTTDGDYVTSFGQLGNKEDKLRWPHSICVDQEGFVYVTDTEANKVLCL